MCGEVRLDIFFVKRWLTSVHSVHFLTMAMSPLNGTDSAGEALGAVPEVLVTPKPTFGSTRTLHECRAEATSPSWKNKLLCWKPMLTKSLMMKCSCMNSATSYERLPHVSTYLELDSIYSGDSDDKDSSTEKQEQLVFYNDDNSQQTVVVEKNLCVSDLCQLLAMKNRVAKDVNWTIIEHWIDLGLERCLEDNEDILAVYQNMESFCKRSGKKFVFRKDFSKYDFFRNPEQCFPNSMIDFGDADDDALNETKTSFLQSILLNGDECPVVFSLVWVRDVNKQVWSKGYLVLKDRKLYLSFKVNGIKKLLRSGSRSGSSSESSPSNSLSCSPNNNKASHEEAEVFADLSDYEVYRTLNAKNQLRAPTEFGVCLRPIRANVHGDGADAALAALKCLACESERARLCWITAMRLAKYGKQLRENYRSFRNKRLESMSPKEYNNFILPSDVRSRVAMDFTGSQGRIVDDPKEARAIAVAEGYSWKRRWRPVLRHPSGKMTSVHGTQNGIHVTQPWFHSGMTREMAAALVMKYGTVDGVFLVRESQSNPGAFVLTLKSGNRVLHKEISPVPDVMLDGVCYSLDGGQTRFYDLLQLVEFYQLNAGVLATRLTHYVVQGTVAGTRQQINRLPMPNSL